MRKLGKIQAIPVGIALLCALLCLTATAQNQKTSNFNFNVTGISGAPLDNVNARLQLEREVYGKFLKPGAARHLYYQSKRHIKTALKPFGYYHAKVYSKLKHQGNQWQASFQVKAGPTVHIRSIDVRLVGPGRNNKKLLKLLAHFPLKKGDVLNTKQYELEKQRMLDLASRLGYLKANLSKHEIRVDLALNTADIILYFNTGPRYRFGHTHFNKTPFARSFLDRYLPYHKGEPYSYNRLLTLQDALSSSNYFQRVLVRGGKRNEQDYSIPVEVSLLPRKPRLYSAGVGFGTDTGPRASLGFDWRWTNRYGHYMTSVLNASKVQSSLIARYIIPGNHPQRENYSILGGVQNIDIKNVGRSFTQQVGWAYQFKTDRWQQSYGINYQRERSKIIGQDEIKAKYLMPNASWIYVHGNKPIFPTRGYRIGITARIAAKSLLSSSNFLQTEVHAKWVQPLTKYNRFILRGDAGYTVGNSLRDIPISLQFWAGGVQSLRGYGFRTLGPGRYLLTGGAEIQQKLHGKLYAAFFVDEGNAFNRFPMHALRGQGFGLVYQSPVGAIAVSYSRAMSYPGHPHRFEFSIGPLL